MSQHVKLKRFFIMYLSISLLTGWNVIAFSQDKAKPSDTSTSDLSARQILQKIEELYRSKGSEGSMEMDIITPDMSRTLKMDIWTKDRDYTFVTINEPKKDKGVSSLKRQNEMWNFFPKINKVIKVSSSMMMGAWMGSDFTNDDLVSGSSLVNDYSMSVDESVTGKLLLTLTPKKEAISLWGKIILTIDKVTQLPEKQEFFDETGQKIRIMTYKDVKTIGSRTLPTTLELEPLNKKGHKTIVRYSNMNFDKDVPDTVFMLNNLQKRR